MTGGEGSERRAVPGDYHTQVIVGLNAHAARLRRVAAVLLPLVWLAVAAIVVLGRFTLAQYATLVSVLLLGAATGIYFAAGVLHRVVTRGAASHHPAAPPPNPAAATRHPPR